MPILRPFKYIQNTLPSKLALNVLHRTNEICLIERSFDSTKAEKVPFLHRYSYWKYNGHIHVIAHDTKKKIQRNFYRKCFEAFKLHSNFFENIHFSPQKIPFETFKFVLHSNEKQKICFLVSWFETWSQTFEHWLGQRFLRYLWCKQANKSRF